MRAACCGIVLALGLLAAALPSARGARVNQGCQNQKGAIGATLYTCAPVHPLTHPLLHAGEWFYLVSFSRATSGVTMDAVVNGRPQLTNDTSGQAHLFVLCQGTAFMVGDSARPFCFTHPKNGSVECPESGATAQSDPKLAKTSEQFQVESSTTGQKLSADPTGALKFSGDGRPLFMLRNYIEYNSKHLALLQPVPPAAHCWLPRAFLRCRCIRHSHLPCRSRAAGRGIWICIQYNRRLLTVPCGP